MHEFVIDQVPTLQLLTTSRSVWLNAKSVSAKMNINIIQYPVGLWSPHNGPQ